jgi:hypothetical protein
MRAFILPIAAGLLLLPQVGTAQTLGEACVPNPDAPVRPGITCQATDEFDYQLPFIGNAQKGDILLSASCGMIGGLLREVSPRQRFSHSGIMIDNWTRLRHSTSAEERYVRGAHGDGLVVPNLKYGWPGVINETIGEAYEGHYLIDPEGEAFFLRSFNRDTARCPGDSAAIFPSVVKPPFGTDQNQVTGTSRTVRQTLEGIADSASAINGHYRLYAYSDADLVGRLLGPGSQADSNAPWAKTSAPDATVCSQLIWSAARAAGVQVEDSRVEIGDKMHAPGAAKNGLYLYSEEERRNAGHWLYDQVYNLFYEEAGWLGEMFTDAPDDGANQFGNCLAFDWCGNEPGMELEGEPDAKDSTRWQNPGPGTAVSPDNLTQWDAPPGGVYGHIETLAYHGGEFTRTHRWAASPGTGPVTVNVRFNNAPAAGAVVTLRGFQPALSDSSGVARFVAIPSGTYQLEGIKEVILNGIRQNVSATTTVLVGAGPGATATLVLTGTPPPPPSTSRAHRRVSLWGTIRITDHENFGSDEIDSFAVNQSIVLDPVSRKEHTFVFDRCTGGEVRVVAQVRVVLNPADSSVTATITARLYEGDTCSSSGVDDEYSLSFHVAENGSTHPTPVDLINGYAFGNDKANLNLNVVNHRNTN